MQRLENLEITKVAFVPEGDNKRADVLLFKSKQNDPGAVTVTEKEAGVMKRVLLAIGKALGFTDEGGPNANPAGNLAADPQQKSVPADNKAGGNPGEPTKKGAEESDMKIDKTKLTPEELAQLEAIEKKAGIQEPDPKTADDGVKKNEPQPAKTEGDGDTKKAAPEGKTEDGEDIYKGLHPEVAKELKELRKRADAAEERELLEVAKKYELVGKKPEELAKTLKAMKSAGGSAYDDMISVLDASLALAEKSGAFSEVGKSGSGQPDAWDQIEKHAAEILKASPTLSRAEAIEKACEQHPELVAEYENNR